MIETRTSQPQHWPLAAATAVMGAALCLAAPESPAQVLDQGVITEQGTQFITEPEPPRQPAEPAESDPQPEPRPAPRAETPPPPPPPPAPPPRYPAVVFLLDTSDSMLNRAANGRTTLLAEAKAAMKRVVAGMSDQTRAQVWIFNTRMNKLKMRRETRSGFVRIGAPGSRR